jgi:hypothetical protein
MNETMWVLILVALYVGESDDGDKVITTIPGYTSLNDCDKAAQAALEKVQAAFCIPEPVNIQGTIIKRHSNDDD